MAFLGLATLMVRDYDEAIAYYTSPFGFELREDTVLELGKRWVVVAPPGARECGILLARAADVRQQSRVGDQTGGRVGFFLHTDDFEGDFRRMTHAGVSVEQEPRDEPYGTVAVVVDLYGNRWDLIQPRQRAT